jgi:hypothetical protein
MAAHLTDMKQVFEKRVEELKEQYQDQLTRAQQKIKAFEAATEFETVLQTYND